MKVYHSGPQFYDGRIQTLSESVCDTMPRDSPDLFSHDEVQAALTWKYGRLKGAIFVESVFPLVDEYRAFLARRADEPKS